MLSMAGLASRFFKLAYRQVVSQGNELLKKDFCLVSASPGLPSALMQLLCSCSLTLPGN